MLGQAASYARGHRRSCETKLCVDNQYRCADNAEDGHPYCLFSEWLTHVLRTIVTTL